MGNFQIHSFEVKHNVPCCGFLIGHEEIGKLLYVTDTSYVPYRFKNLNTMLLEANWGEEYIHRDEVKYHHSLQHHMSIETAVGCIGANTNTEMSHIILCHLSGGNSHQERFKEAVKGIVPGYVTVDVAEPGLTVSVDNIPF